MGNDSDDESLTLSSHAMAALAEFNAERDAHQQQFEKLKAEAEKAAADGDGDNDGTPLSMKAFDEDWNESQFWYSDATASTLARELLNGATENTTIVVVSAPSVFVAVKNMLKEGAGSGTSSPKLFLLEHDARFSVFKEFVHYDFQQPLKLPAHLKGSADRIICDPPFLSDDCQTKAALTVRWLAKPRTGNSTPTKLTVCTGERMEKLVTKLYRSFGLRTTTFEPAHARGLSNEFYCYANFECTEWEWRQASGPQ